MRSVKLIFFAVMTTFLLTSCRDKEGKVGENPFFSDEWRTPFGVPPFDKIQNEHYMPAFEAAMAEHLAEIEQFTNSSDPATFENTIVALDNAGATLERVSNVFFLLCNAEADDEMKLLQAEISPMVAAHSDKISMNDALFQRIKSVYDGKDAQSYDAAQLRLLEKTYNDFVRSGALLDDAKKEELKAINEEMSRLTVQFGTNVTKDNKAFTLVVDSAGTAGVPRSIVEAAREEAKNRDMANKFVFTLDKPSLIPFITYSDDRDLRKQLYEGYLNRGNNGNEYDNKAIINRLAEIRLKKAQLLGFESCSEFTLDNVMAKTPANVYSLLDELWTPALESANKELEEMRAIKQRETGSGDFASWDWWYYAEKVRKDKYSLDEEMLRPYFSLENVREGIFNLCNRLYGITFRPVAVPHYHKECSAFEVLDIDNSHLAILYLDFHPRDGKKVGAWCGRYRTQHYKDSVKVTPVVTIVCNFTRPASAKPALLNLDEVGTFFHEFGHALHFMFTDVPYKGLVGVERDFVELPSQIMENWAFEPEVLKKYATHFSTNDVIPDALIEKISNSKYFNQGFTTVEYLAASYIDMDIHNIKEYKSTDIVAYEKELLNQKRGLIRQIEPRYRFPYFVHVFSGGYTSGYYSYIWAEVLDKDAYEAFVESGDLFNRAIATKFRKEVLEKGGSADGMTLYTNFRGAEPQRWPLLVGRGLMERPVSVVAEEVPLEGDVQEEAEVSKSK